MTRAITDQINAIAAELGFTKAVDGPVNRPIAAWAVGDGTYTTDVGPIGETPTDTTAAVDLPKVNLVDAKGFANTPRYGEGNEAWPRVKHARFSRHIDNSNEYLYLEFANGDVARYLLKPGVWSDLFPSRSIAAFGGIIIGQLELEWDGK